MLDADVQHFRDCMETNVYGPLRLMSVRTPARVDRVDEHVVPACGGREETGERVQAPLLRASTVACSPPSGGRAAPRFVAQGADTIVWCATLPSGGPSGRFFHDRK